MGVSAIIKPWNELVWESPAIKIGKPGGIVVGEQMAATAVSVYVIGKISLYNNFICGLVATEYNVAGIWAKSVAWNGLGLGLGPAEEAAFIGAKLSTKLKLLGCNAMSFVKNQPPANDLNVSNLVRNDSLRGIYRKLIFRNTGDHLCSSILI